jgi:hypothetical protein
MTIAQLDHAAVGRPITRAGISLFPIHLPRVGDHDPTAMIDDRTDGVVITEQASAAVPSILVTNRGERPVLLVEGETITGGQQNRTLNVSVLVPAASTITVPVSCVEAGRWSGERAFARGRTFASRRVRRVKTASVRNTVQHGNAKYSDQGAVWSTIDAELSRVHKHNPTASLLASEALLEDDSVLREATTELIARGPLPGQCGVVVSHGSRIVAVEVFATPGLLRSNWEPLVRAIMLDTPVELRGRPSASRALDFLHRIATATSTDAPGVGLGRESHVRTGRLVGQALTLDGFVVHASAFALAA